MTPPVIGLTLNFRDAERTSSCVQSLLDDGALAVLVWDNSEDDGTSVAKLRSRWSDDTRVILSESPGNLGFAAGVNQALAAIAFRWPGAWAMLLNNDAVLRPGALAELHAALLEQQMALIAYPIVSHGGKEIGKVFYQPQWGFFFQQAILGSVAYASGCALLIAPERESQPLFDEAFFMYGEDVMLGYRLGTPRMVHVPRVLVEHEGSASSGMGSPFYESRIVAAHWLLARKMANGKLELAVNLLGRTVTLGVRGLVRSLRYRSLTPFRALRDGLQLASGKDPELIKARQALALRSAAEEGDIQAVAKQLPP